MKLQGVFDCGVKRYKASLLITSAFLPQDDPEMHDKLSADSGTVLSSNLRVISERGRLFGLFMEGSLVCSVYQIV